MAQAVTYKRKKNFLENAGDATDHGSINNELDAIAESIKGLRENQALLITDQGVLNVNIITAQSLTPEAIAILKGDKGDKGDDGEKGEQGEPGPEGPRGYVGASFNPDIEDIISNRPLYDLKPKGFSFLAMDEGKLYWKLSDTSADWSEGYVFGKGEKGDKGDDGEKGVQGDRGLQGIEGKQGEQGEPGKDGKDGVITAVDTTVKTANIIGRSKVSMQLVLNGNQLTAKLNAE